MPKLENIWAGERLVSAALVIALIVFVVLGRILTFHLTEGEALIAGWPYWAGAAASAVLLAFWMRR